MSYSADEKSVRENEGTDEPERKITRSDWKRYFRPRNLTVTFEPEIGRNVCVKYNAASSWGRCVQTLKILSVSVIAMIALLAFVVIDVIDAQQQIAKERTVQKGIETSISVANLIHRLQIERGTTVLCISSEGSWSVGQDLESARTYTDSAISNLANWPVGGGSLESREKFVRFLESYRNNGDHTNCRLNVSIAHTLNSYSRLIDVMLDWLSDSIERANSNAVLFQMIGYRLFLIAKEKTGLERAMGGSFFSRGYYNNTEELVYYVHLKTIGETFLDHSMDFMPALRKHMSDAARDIGDINVTTLIDLINSKRSVILKNIPNKGSVTEGLHWFQLMTSYINILLSVQRKAGHILVSTLLEDIRSSENQLTIRLVILACVLVTTPLLFLAVTKMTNAIQQFALKLSNITKSLTDEQQRTDDLLSAMFPRPVAETLKKGERVNAEQFDCVTVFFSDIVNFTNICSKVTPMMVTRMLNNVYSVFDEEIDKHDVYKVETIGDAYMVVSGLPLRNGTKHADEIARVALNLVHLTDNLELEEMPVEERLWVRVGLHTAQKIHISETTHDLLEKFDTYIMEYRGSVTMKGKGSMDTYWLLGFKDVAKPASAELPGLVNNGYLLDE